MIHNNVLFGYDYDDESKTLIAKDWIRQYGFFSTFTLMLTSIMAVYKKFGVLVENIDSREALHLLKREVPLDFDIYSHFFKIDKDYKLPEDFDMSGIDFGPNHHHTIYDESHLKYFLPFVKKYFTLSDNVLAKSEELKTKYNLNSEKNISVVFRDSDKWTDLGGFNYVSAAAYLRHALDIKEKDPECTIVIQTENEGVKQHFVQGFQAIFIHETKTGLTSTTAPLLHFTEDILGWATDYAAALYIHSQSKYLITYTGNSAFFLYLLRGSTKNLYQEKTFEMNYKDFFTSNYNSNL
jgi:hypothetical protein